MVFNSFTFLIFFAIVLFLHRLPLAWRTKKANLLLASYLFYAAWNPPFVLLLWLSTLVDWYTARLIGTATRPIVRNAALAISLLVNLGMLAFFKYGNFGLENFISFAALLGIDYSPPPFDIILPVGISFYTFQTLSYTIDVYRGNAKPWTSFLDFALYVTFFPQLVAGPIVRATDFLPQCETPRRATGNDLGWGLNLLLIGLFEKIVIADGLLAPVVETVYSATAVNTISAWTGTLAFAGQIFCDFAGYSTCAIGAAMCLGFGLPDNFRYPYAAVGFSDFWRRWHISLSTWLRDYLYIPLGGNRGTIARTQLNLMLTMLIGGLWHGAAWTFVFWGALHGLYLVVERALKSVRMAKWPIWKTTPAQFGLAILTFLLVCLTWTFFRAESLHQAIEMAWSMISFDQIHPLPSTNGVLPDLGKWDLFVTAVTMSSIFGIHWLMRGRTLEDVADRTPTFMNVALNAILIVAIIMMPGEDRAFIYFQF